MRVLGIVGSPRKGGNTDSMVEEVLRGAAEAGAEVDKVVLGDLRIEPCKACDVCRKGECVIEDDFASVAGKMESAHVWVIGTPVYWWGPSAQTKAWIDRWYGLPRELFEGKGVVLAVSSGGGRSYAELTISMLREVIPYLGMREMGLVHSGGSSRGRAKSDTVLMSEARRIGKSIVKQMS